MPPFRLLRRETPQPSRWRRNSRGNLVRHVQKPDGTLTLTVFPSPSREPRRDGQYTYCFMRGESVCYAGENFETEEDACNAAEDAVDVEDE
jgi:hypothetical protein